MNRIIIYPHEYNTKSQVIHIEDKIRYQHITQHLKSKEQDQIKLVLPEQYLLTGKIKSITQEKILIQAIQNEGPGLERSPLVLYIALSRPQAAKKIIEHTVGFPVSTIHFFLADLTEKSYVQSAVYSLEKIKELQELGLSQSGVYTTRPKINISTLEISHFFDESCDQAFFLDQKGQSTAKILDTRKQTHLFIGPERGWSERERELFSAHEISPIYLGRAIQRVEIACFTALAQFELLLL